MIRLFTTKEGFLVVPFDGEVKEKAIAWADSRPISPEADNAYTNKFGLYYGHAGEEVFRLLFKGAPEWVGEKTHDFIWNGFKVDVKAKAGRKTPPLHWYDCSLPLYQFEHTTPEIIYVFGSWLKDKTAEAIKALYFMGWISREDFGKVCVKKEPGFIDTNKQRYKKGSYDIKVRDIKNKFGSPLSQKKFAYTMRNVIDLKY